MKINPLEYTGSRLPTASGAITRPATTTIRPAQATFGDIALRSLSRRLRPVSTKRPLGVNRSTAKRTMNGSDGGNPARFGTSTTYFVARAPPMPITRPPA